MTARITIFCIFIDLLLDLMAQKAKDIVTLQEGKSKQ